MERQVNILEKEIRKDVDIKKKAKDKLPFAVFVCPKTQNEEIDDYKQIFTDIISDRIKEKYRQKTKQNFAKNC